MISKVVVNSKFDNIYANEIKCMSCRLIPLDRSLVPKEGSSMVEIKRRIIAAKIRLAKLWKSRDITMNTKVRLVKTLDLLLDGKENRYPDEY